MGPPDSFRDDGFRLAKVGRRSARRPIEYRLPVSNGMPPVRPHRAGALDLGQM